jgi:peptidyl-prolyl cis-trans isomerase C
MVSAGCYLAQSGRAAQPCYAGFMKAFVLAGVLCAGLLRAQTAAPAPQQAASFPDLPDDTVIAHYPDGTALTMEQFKVLYKVLPPNMQQMALQNRQEFLEEISMLRDLTKIAEKDKLDQESPYKEALAFSRLMVLAQAAMSEANKNAAPTENAEGEKRYQADREKYKQVRVKMIKVAFTPNEAAAKAKAEKIVADARRGADFVKLVQQYSDDKATKDKAGDFGVVKLSDNNDAVRLAVFSLKKGEVSDPVRQQSGFFIFRAEEISYQPFNEVRNDVFGQLQTERYKVWLDGIHEASKLKDVNPAFLAPHPPARPKSQM